MKTVSLRYGGDQIKLRLPDSAHILTAGAVAPLADPERQILRSLRNPIGAEPLDTLAQGRACAAIVVSDNTRPAPYKGRDGILAPIIKALLNSGVNRIKVIVACGTHRPLEEWELRSLFDPVAFQPNVQIINHQAEDQSMLRCIGSTERTPNVMVNRHYLDADLKILTGLIEPHFMAGFSGGRKAVCPGITGQTVAYGFHSASILDAERSRSLVLEGNPCHEESLRIARMAGADFILNVTVDSSGSATGVFAGDMEKAHMAGVEHLLTFAAIPISKFYDLVITHAGHVGVNHYQCAKAAVEAARAVKPGGSIVLLANPTDSEPVGGEKYRQMMKLLASLGADAFREKLLRKDWTFVPEQWQAQMWAKVFQRLGSAKRLYICAPRLINCPEDMLPETNVAAQHKPQENKDDPAFAGRIVQETIDQLLTHGAAKSILLLPDGPYAVPVHQTGAQGDVPDNPGMMRALGRNVGCAVAAFWISLCLLSYGGDWPMQRKDAARSRVTDETLTFPMQCVWQYQPAQPPQPAWSEPPPGLQNQMDFDCAPAPVIAAGILYFGSSADDTVRALDAVSGAERWQFTAGGPIRFAPQVVSNHLFFAADDGVVYCLQATDGAVCWTFNAAPVDERYIGNRRMISRWPIRTGVLVQDGLVYAVAGIWATEGIYIYALNADTGAVVWLNDTSGWGRNPVAGAGGGEWSIGDPHRGEFDTFGLTPQGLLLATQKTLIVPQANNAVVQFNLKGLALKGIGDNSVSGTTPFLDGVMHYSLRDSRGVPGVMLYGRTLEEEGVKKGLVQLYGANLPLPAADLADRSLKKVDAIVSGDERYVRRAGGLALTANALLVGRRDEIVAEDRAGTQTLWRAAVQGLAREIAVANGRVYVATDEGMIYAFATGKDSGGGVQGSGFGVQEKSEIRNLKSQIAKGGDHAPSTINHQPSTISRLRSAGIDRGVALVLGDEDAALSRALAAQTALHVLNVSANTNTVAALRTHLLRETAWYGSRIHVIYVPDLRRLPFAQYVANAVIVAGAGHLSGKELYRVLHPCGGVMLFPGLSIADAQKLIKETGVSESEIRAPLTPNTYHLSPITAPRIVRGPLPGARDWDTQPPTDQRVKWPLRPLWFGGPEAAQVRTSGHAAHPPVAARGRYFGMGDACLTAVDAYNSMTLWSRPIPSLAANRYEVDGLVYAAGNNAANTTVDVLHGVQRILEADDRHVYLRLGAGWFQGRGEALFQLDARTGAQRSLCAPYLPPTTNMSLAGARASPTWAVPLDEYATGRVALAQTDAGIALTLAAPAHSERDLLWEVCFDFRAPDQRYGLYDDGAFALLLTPPRDESAARGLPVPGPRPPAWQLQREEKAGWATTTLVFTWPELEQWRGQRPDGFDLAVAGVRLMERAGKTAEARRISLFGDDTARYLNRAWARVTLGGAPPATNPPAVWAGEIGQRPTDWRWPEMHDPLIVKHPGELSPAYRTATRLHPLTGEPGLRVYRSGAIGCGFPVYSAHDAIGRTTKTALGFYDFADDSGLRMFPGLAANCGVHVKAQNMTAALGLLIFSDSRSHCTCLIPIRTSMAFAPAERRLREDWAIFCDRNADAPVRRAAINLGAPGDRRDEQGALWLGFPRLADGKAYPREPGSARFLIQSPPIASALNVPLKVACLPACRGWPRFNADRLRIEGTDRPWLYASCLLGVTNMTLALEPAPVLVATAAETTPVLDGCLESSFWTTNSPTHTLRFTGAQLFLRHDARALYLGAQRKCLPDEKGRPAAWTQAAKGEDAAVERDDSFEFFLSDTADAAVVHLGVSASGARYDALARGREPERAAWNGTWQSAARANETGLVVELALPWDLLQEAGVDRNRLALNVQVNQQNRRAELPIYPLSDRLVSTNQTGIGDCLLSLGPLGRARCANFTPVGLGRTPSRKPRLFTVRLHFADLVETNAPGARAFDIRLQGQTVLENFDIVKEAGAPLTALVKEFKQVSATETLTLEFVPAVKNPTRETAPILCGMDMAEE